MEYPKKQMEFEKQFATGEQCREYLFQLRYPEGFKCPKCGGEKAWRTGRGKYQCQTCRKDTSVLTGTIFQDTHTPLTIWFRAIWYVVAQKHGASALNLRRILGLGSYQTARTMLYKLRCAMIRPGREKLKGRVEIDETYIDGVIKSGRFERGSERKALVVIAVEVNDNQIGRIRLKLIITASSEQLLPFIEDTVEHGSTIITDGRGSYNGLKGMDYHHEIERNGNGEKDSLLPHAHTAASLLKRWILGTLQGSCSKEHFAYYLDEYTFRYNHRKSKNRGPLFLRLLENAVQIEAAAYKQRAPH
jgi:transposase-like protein